MVTTFTVQPLPDRPMNEFFVGDKVRKAKGYKYPGVVVSWFETLAGEIRYVVEATGEEYKGMLHIFNGDQLEKEL